MEIINIMILNLWFSKFKIVVKKDLKKMLNNLDNVLKKKMKIVVVVYYNLALF